MSISLARVLEILNLDISTVKTGKDALNNTVEKINMVEAPDALEWLAENEFLLTTGYALQGNYKFQKTFLQQIAKKGIAGLGVKAGRHLDPIPPHMIKEGQRLNFPIIELPACIPLSQIITIVCEELLNQQVCILKRSRDIHTKFLNIVLRGDGFDSICTTLTSLIGMPCVIIDVNNQMEGYTQQASFSLSKDEEIKLLNQVELKYDASIFSETYKFISLKEQVQRGIGDLAVFPIRGGNHFWGAIIILGAGNDMDFQKVIACEHAVTVAALEFAKQDSIFRANLTSESQLLDDISAGNFSSFESIQRRLDHFGFQLQGRLKTIVLDIVDFEAYYMQQAKKDEKHFQMLKDDIYRLTKVMFHGFPGSLLGGVKSDSIIAIVSIKNGEVEKTFKRIISALSKALKQEFPLIKISCGISKAYKKLNEVPRSFEEAFVACKVARNLNKNSLVAYFDDLGVYACLNEIRESSMALRLYEETIGLLEIYDKKHGAELTYTLQNYFLNNGNVQQTANKLFVHRNSLEYRLKRIEELTGRKLDCFHEWFELVFSLELGKLLKTKQNNVDI